MPKDIGYSGLFNVVDPLDPLPEMQRQDLIQIYGPEQGVKIWIQLQLEKEREKAKGMGMKLKRLK